MIIQFVVIVVKQFDSTYIHQLMAHGYLKVNYHNYGAGQKLYIYNKSCWKSSKYNCNNDIYVP